MSETKSKRANYHSYLPGLAILIAFIAVVLYVTSLRNNVEKENAGLLYTYAEEYQQTIDDNRKAELERLMLPLADQALTREASANPLLGIIPTIDLILRCNLWVGSWENSSLAPYGSGWDVDAGMLMCMNDPSVMSRGEMIAE